MGIKRLTCRKCGRIETNEEIRPGNWTNWFGLRYTKGYFRKWALCTNCSIEVIEFVEGKKPELSIVDMPEIKSTAIP